MAVENSYLPFFAKPERFMNLELSIYSPFFKPNLSEFLGLSLAISNSSFGTFLLMWGNLYRPFSGVAWGDLFWFCGGKSFRISEIYRIAECDFFRTLSNSKYRYMIAKEGDILSAAPQSFLVAFRFYPSFPSRKTLATHIFPGTWCLG